VNHYPFPLARFFSKLLMLSILGVSLSIPPFLVYLGRISFGLYVFHLLAINLTDYVDSTFLGLPGWYGVRHMLHLAASLLLTIAVAAFSYRFFETPFLKLKERFAVIASRPICILPRAMRASL
jgi:peptidoglycan/LPS O-acetylase OafA/YrhL